MNNLEKYNPAGPAEVIPVDPTKAVLFWDNLAAQFARATVAAQVMCGFALLELQEKSGAKRGGDHKSGIKTDVFGFDSWGEFLRKTFNFTDDTARARMEMARGVKSDFKKLGLGERFRALLQTHPSQWSAEDVKLISTSLAKCTDGMTQTDFFRQLGLAKQLSRGTGRLPGCDNTKKKLSLSEEAEIRKLQATMDWEAIAGQMGTYQDKFLLLTDTDVTAQIAVLEQALNARKAWLKQPANDRKPAVIAAMFETSRPVAAEPVALVMPEVVMHTPHQMPDGTTIKVIGFANGLRGKDGVERFSVVFNDNTAKRRERSFASKTDAEQKLGIRIKFDATQS